MYQAIRVNRGRKIQGRIAVQDVPVSPTTLEINSVTVVGNEPERALITIQIPLDNNKEGVKLLTQATPSTDLESLQFGNIELDLGKQIAAGNPEISVVTESDTIYLIAKVAILGKKKESGS